MSIEAFTWVMGIVFGWALHATLVHERIGHVVLAMTAIAVAAHRLEMDDAGTVSAATVFLIGGISFLVMAVASRLWAEAIEAYWRNQGGSLGSTLAGWEPFFAWRPVCVDSSGTGCRFWSADAQAFDPPAARGCTGELECECSRLRA